MLSHVSRIPASFTRADHICESMTLLHLGGSHLLLLRSLVVPAMASIVIMAVISSRVRSRGCAGDLGGRLDAAAGVRDIPLGGW